MKTFFYFDLFCPQRTNLPQPPSLTLPLQQAQDVAFAHGSLYVADDGAAGIVDEFDADLGDITGVSSAAKDAVYFGELDGLIHYK